MLQIPEHRRGALGVLAEKEHAGHRCACVASVLRLRYEREGRPADLNRAIELLAEAGARTLVGEPLPHRSRRRGTTVVDDRTGPPARTGAGEPRAEDESRVPGKAANSIISRIGDSVGTRSCRAI